MNLWQMVLADHANIAELCREVLYATASGPNSRASLFDELDRELHRHFRVKENVLYPALSRDDRTKGYMQDLHRDRDEIRHSLDALASRHDVNSRDWALEFKNLLGRLELYFTTEENGALTVARGVIGGEQADALRRSYEREKIAFLESRRWHMPPQMMPSRYGASSGLVFGLVAGAAALGAAAYLWRSTHQHAENEPLRPVRRQPEPPFPLRSRVEAGRLDTTGRASGASSSRMMREGDDLGLGASAGPGASGNRSSENWFSSANPPHAPSGLSSGLQPGGVVPGGGPAASAGAVGTGGGPTAGTDTGSFSRDGR